MRRKYWVALLTLTLVLSAFGVATAAPPAAKNFIATLSGSQEVPAVESAGEGAAIFHLSEDGNSLSFKLNVEGLTGIRMAHIHMAPPGSNGGVVVWLFPGAPPPVVPGVDVSGTLAEGVITVDSLGGALDDDWAGFISALYAGNLYVNVHTDAYPTGEIRGQIRTAGPAG